MGVNSERVPNLQKEGATLRLESLTLNSQLTRVDKLPALDQT